MVVQDCSAVEQYLVAASKAGQLGFSATQAAFEELVRSTLTALANSCEPAGGQMALARVAAERRADDQGPFAP